MWIAVTRRFKEFNQNILLTDQQVEDGKIKHWGVRSCLNSHYYGHTSDTDNSFLGGSWGKNTCVRPPRDIDVYFVLPPSVHDRFESYAGNKQSALLQEVKSVLKSKYSSTEMRGDGQVVVVKFATINVEVVPAFELTNGQYRICDTNKGGSYKVADPVAEKDFIASVHAENSNNLRPLIRMIKTWQSACSVPIKSFHLELLAADYLKQCEWRLNGYYYYDWLVRDFFAYLTRQVNGYVVVAGTYEVIALGNAWQSRCDSAYSRALKACEHERLDEDFSAGYEWQKIFGDDIPLMV